MSFQRSFVFSLFFALTYIQLECFSFDSHDSGINKCEIPSFWSQNINEKDTCIFECQVKDRSDFTRSKASGGPALLLFNWQDSICKQSINEKEITVVVNKTNVMALDYSFQKGIIFWGDKSEDIIYKAPIDGKTEAKIVVQENMTEFDGLAVDWIYNNVYLASSRKRTTEVFNFEGKKRKTLFKTLSGSIALDPLQGWMFWAVWDKHPRIEKGGMDGSRQENVTTEVGRASGLTLDILDKRIYWVDTGRTTIASCGYDGSRQRTFLRSPDMLTYFHTSIATFEDWLFWTDRNERTRNSTIYRTNKFTGQNVKKIISMPLKPHSRKVVVAVYHLAKQPSGINYCSSMANKCSTTHLCLPAPQIDSTSPKITCAYTDEHLLSDNLTCKKKSAPEPSVLKSLNRPTNTARPSTSFPMNNKICMAKSDQESCFDFKLM